MTTGETWRTDHGRAPLVLIGGLALLLAGIVVLARTGRIEIAGALRPDDDGNWALIEDAAHKPRGIADVQVDNAGRVVVTFDQAGTAVVTFVVTPDESMAAAGYEAGASVGLDRAIITLAPNVNYNRIGGTANLWVYGVLET